MRKFTLLLILAITLTATAMNGAAQALDGALSPLGTWATPDGGAHIQVSDCGGTLCGTITWLRHPREKDGTESVDSKNPNSDLRLRKLLGLQLMAAFTPDGADPTVWKNGWIYDASSGKTYSCTLTLESATTMRVRGYIGLSLFGKTQVWTRVTPQILAK
ncbi:MAG TPA: DUF2147 domain-containing protein [Candidatus Binataceae bacterium]|nr:DUF2147 domain-containing protein [Candidatus Binataceae bacterium]